MVNTVRLACLFLLFATGARAIDQFDIQVCEAQATDADRISCFLALAPSATCKNPDLLAQLDCLRAAATSSSAAVSSQRTADKKGPTSPPRSVSGPDSGTFDTPPCYREVPTTCGFNEMTLELCNRQGANHGSRYSISSRSYAPGGNVFRSVDGRFTCTVNKIRGTEPARYRVNISR